MKCPNCQEEYLSSPGEILSSHKCGELPDVKLIDPPGAAEFVPPPGKLADAIYKWAHDNDMQIWDGLVTEKTFDNLYTYAKGLEYALECLKPQKDREE